MQIPLTLALLASVQLIFHFILLIMLCYCLLRAFFLTTALIFALYFYFSLKKLKKLSEFDVNSWASPP